MSWPSIAARIPRRISLQAAPLSSPAWHSQRAAQTQPIRSQSRPHSHPRSHPHSASQRQYHDHCSWRPSAFSIRDCEAARRLPIARLDRPPSRHSFSSATSFTATNPSALQSDDTTIYALSSAPGKAGIAVIRISGPACLDIYKALCPAAPRLRPRYAAVRTLYDPAASTDTADDNILDNSVVLYFPGPKSVTGEDVLELHVHGGPATVKAVLAAIPRAHAPGSPGAPVVIRYAEPGEFTRRAFFRGRLDLAQVESLGDALDAATEQQRRAAVRGSSGALGRAYEAWRAQLLAARAEIEALIDFSEDQHFDESPRALLEGVAGQVRSLLRKVRAHEAAADRGGLLRHGIRLALVGPANAGKSSLMNLVVGREASIVSGEAGTTRDVVEARLDVRGFLCTFADTAGFRPAAARGAVEAEGIRRARQQAADADVVIVLASLERAGGDAEGGPLHVSYDEETLRLAARARRSMVVLNKCDLAPDAAALARLVDEFRASVDRVLASEVLDKESVDSAGVSSSTTNAATSLLTISCRAAEASAAGAAARAVPAAAVYGQHSAPAGGGAMSAPETAGTTSAPASTASRASRTPTSSSSADPGGIHALVDTLAAAFASMTDLPPDAQDLLGVTARQQQLLARCRAHLEDFLREAAGGEEEEAAVGLADEDGLSDPDIVLAAEHLRYAADCLARITGRGEAGDTEEVLGVIFEKFCVGK